LEVRPDAVLGDAFEAYNFHHDVARLLLDDAVAGCRRRGRPVENYEFPLACRPAGEGAGLVYGRFPSGPSQVLHLTAGEERVKRRLVREVARLDPLIAEAVARFPPPGREAYRPVPPGRDY